MRYNIQSKIFITVLGMFIAAGIEAKTSIELPTFIYDGKRLDAKAVGMGEAFVSVCDNPSAAYWNPAGIKQLQRNYFFTCFDVYDKTDASGSDLRMNDPLGDKQLLIIGLAAKEGAFSIRPITHYSGTYNNRDIEIKVNKYSLSSSSEYSERMLVGLNLNYLSGNMGVVDNNNMTARVSGGSGVSFDWGLLYKLNDFVNLGFAAENAPGYIWWEEYDRHILKAHIQTGFSIKYSQGLLLAAEYENKNVDFERKDYYHFGIQESLYKTVYLRQGMTIDKLSKTKSDKNAYTFGIGILTGKGLTADVSAKTQKLENLQKDRVINYLMSVNIPF